MGSTASATLSEKESAVAVGQTNTHKPATRDHTDQTHAHMSPLLSLCRLSPSSLQKLAKKLKSEKHTAVADAAAAKETQKDGELACNGNWHDTVAE